MATVLVVDDVASNREIVGTLLGYRGHRVLEAGAASEALALARCEHPDIIVTDVLMPGMDGYELAAELRRDPLTAATALIFYSGNYSTDELNSIMLESGASRVVSKADGPQELLEAVEEVLEGTPRSGGTSTAGDIAHIRLVNTKMVEKIHELNVSQRHFRLMAEAAPVGVLLVDTDANLTYSNDRLREIALATPEQLCGRGWLRCYHPDQRAELLAAIRDGGHLQQEGMERVRLVGPEGQVRWLNTRLRLVRDDHGAPAGAVGVVDDVTATLEAEQRAIAERHRQDSDARARVGQRLESLRRLAGGVAHDFNNLLAAMLSFGEFVEEALTGQLEAGTLDETVMRTALADIGQVLSAADRARGLSRKLQLFGSRTALQPTAVDLNAVVRPAAEALAAQVGNGVTVDIRLAPDLREALVDAEQVLQVLGELAANARDAMPDGGTLTIETANVEGGSFSAAASASASAASDAQVRLTVRDTGVGMPEDVRTHAVEPFFTTKPRGKGQGLGLAAAYGVAVQVGGDLVIESESGAGTSVHLILPATRPAPAPPPAPPRADTGRPGCILVVDDEEQVREVVARILRRAGYRVLVAPDGPTALELADEHRDEIDCLLTDVVMPRMLGSEVAHRITARYPAIRVLFMSGYADPMLDAPNRIAPDVNILAKPFRENELLAAIQAAAPA
jgi:PAS domain S-box-containing protein